MGSCVGVWGATSSVLVLLPVHHHTSLSADAADYCCNLSPCCWVSHKGLFGAGGQSVGSFRGQLAGHGWV